jgi:hypothetical protein
MYNVKLNVPQRNQIRKKNMEKCETWHQKEKRIKEAKENALSQTEARTTACCNAGTERKGPGQLLLLFYFC